MSDNIQREVDRIGIEGLDLHAVPAMLFNPRGHWKYNVMLDYGRDDPEPSRFWEQDRDAWEALARATQNGTSGVTISKQVDYWVLVVPETPQGYPLMSMPTRLVMMARSLGG